MINESLNLEIWDRLFQGKPLDGLPIPTKNGRLNLGALALPEPTVIQRYQTPTATVSEIQPNAVFQNAKWHNLDFSGSKLSGIRVFGSEIRNCRFDECQLRDLRLWSTTIIGSSFRGSNLKEAALGGVQDGKRNIFSDVDFSEADLRQTSYTAASFERCIFRNTKLAKIDFQTSTFADCKFEGELREVLFYCRGFGGAAFPPNKMVNVDFSRAKLRFVEFRGLSLDRVQLPNDADHIVIKNFDSILDKMLYALKQQEDITGKKLLASLGIIRKWAVPNQTQGVLNIQDFAEMTGEEGVKRLLAAISTSGG